MKIEIHSVIQKPMQSEIDRLEGFAKFSLPKEYLDFISSRGIVRFFENNHISKDYVSIEYLYFFGDEAGSIEKVILDYGDRIPKNFLPIANCAGGNMILIDKKGGVYFWDHEQEKDGDPIAACDFISTDFSKFINDLVPLEAPKNAKVISVKINPDFAKKMGLTIK